MSVVRFRPRAPLFVGLSCLSSLILPNLLFALRFIITYIQSSKLFDKPMNGFIGITLKGLVVVIRKLRQWPGQLYALDGVIRWKVLTKFAVSIMTNHLSFNHKDNVFGNIGRQIGDSLKAARG